MAELAIRGLAALGEPAHLRVDVVTGLPTLTLGGSVTALDVAAALDDE